MDTSINWGIPQKNADLVYLLLSQILEVPFGEQEFLALAGSSEFHLLNRATQNTTDYPSIRLGTAIKSYRFWNAYDILEQALTGYFDQFYPANRSLELSSVFVDSFSEVVDVSPREVLLDRDVQASVCSPIELCLGKRSAERSAQIVGNCLVSCCVTLDRNTQHIGVEGY